MGFWRVGLQQWVGFLKRTESCSDESLLYQSPSNAGAWILMPLHTHIRGALWLYPDHFPHRDLHFSIVSFLLNRRSTHQRAKTSKTMRFFFYESPWCLQKPRDRNDSPRSVWWNKAIHAHAVHRFEGTDDKSILGACMWVRVSPFRFCTFLLLHKRPNPAKSHIQRAIDG